MGKSCKSNCVLFFSFTIYCLEEKKKIFFINDQTCV